MAPVAGNRVARLQRKCASCEEEDRRLQAKREGADGNELEEVPPIVDEVLAGGGQPLEPSARSFFEARLGYDLGRVRVHHDARAAESAQAVNALAYTVGNHVVFGRGGFAPSTSAGRHLLAHELAHVIQQSPPGRRAPGQLAAGPIAPDAAAPVAQRKPIVSAPGDAQEREADAVADHVMRCEGGCGAEHAAGTPGRLISHADSPGAPVLARAPAPGAKPTCTTGHQDGSANSFPDDTSRFPSGTYAIWGTFRPGDRSIESAAQATADNWIRWRFKRLSSAVASRIRSEFLASGWQWEGDPAKAADGCQYRLYMSMAMMNRLVALASHDEAGGKAEQREHGAGLPALPEPEPIADEEIVVYAGGASKTKSAGAGDAKPVDPEQARKQAIERALDPSSVYERGTPGATDPPFPARLEGPQQEILGAIGTYRMVLDYQRVTSEPLMQIAYHMNYVQYHWERFNITQIVKNSIGQRGEKEAASTSRDAARAVKELDVLRQQEKAARAAAMDPKAEVGTLDAAKQRAELASRQLAEEEQKARAQLRDPASAAVGGSSTDVITRYLANQLNLELLDVSKITAAGGLALGALADLLGGPTSEQEVPFSKHDGEGYFMIRCIAQPAPRGPGGSERRAASVATRIVQVRRAEAVVKDVLGEPEAAFADLAVEKELARTEADKARVEAKIKDAQLEATGDVVALLKKRLDDKTAERDRATGYRRAQLDREVEQLKLRYDQAVERRKGTVGPHYRPRAVFASELTGETYPLLLDMSELEADSGKRVRLMDLTRPDSAPIDRNGATLEQAVRNCFTELGGHGGLGRGRLAVRMPADFPGSLPEFVIATADESTAVVKRRLQDLASVLLLLGLFVPGLGEVSAVIAAGLAAERLIERAMNGTLRVDAEMVGDSLAILGAAAQGAQFIGRLRVARSANAFVTAWKDADLPALVKAAEAFEAARKTGQTLETISHLTNLGGLMWGNLVALHELGELADQELSGTLSHSEARRRRAEILLGALRDNAIMFAGAERAQKSLQEGKSAPAAEERPAGKPGPEERPAGKSASEEGKSIPESELQGKAAQPKDASAAPAKDRVRARFPTPDGLHEIFVLEDGRIFRCSTSCAELRTWYDGFLKGQSEATRQATAKSLDAELAMLEAREKAGENTKEVTDAIGALDVKMRDFIAPDLAKELTAAGKAAGMKMSGLTEVLTEAQVRRLLTFLDIDAIRALVGPDGLKDAQKLKRFANRPEAVLREYRRALDSYGAHDAEAMQGLMATVSNDRHTPAMLEAGYKQASELKTKYGDRITGEIIERCVRAAGAADAKQAAAEVALAVDILEGRTPLGGDQKLHGIKSSDTDRRPEYAVTADGTPRRLAEVKRLEGAAGAPLGDNQIERNLRSALGQLRAETQPGDAPGLVRIDGRGAGPTHLVEPDLRQLVQQRVKDAVVTGAAGATRAPNVGFIEILYNDAGGKPSRMVFPVAGGIVGQGVQG